MSECKQKLLKSEGGEFRCSTCFDFRMAPTTSGAMVPYCNRRDRAIGWNPVLFFCTEYAVKDEPQALQTSLDWRWGSRA